MNNKEQLQKQAEKLQEELDKLKEQIEACDEEELEPTRVKKGKNYWYVSGQGLVCTTEERNYISDDSRYIFGNYFKTKEEAIKYADNKRTKVVLQRLAEKLNKGKLIDWKDANQQKFYLFFNHDIEQIETDANQIYQQSRIYCLSSLFKQYAFREIGEQALIDYLKSEV